MRLKKEYGVTFCYCVFITVFYHEEDDFIFILAVPLYAVSVSGC